MKKGDLPQIVIHPLFFVFFLIALLMGKLLVFVLAFLTVTIHEFSHIIIAHRLGYPFELLEILPIGERVRIKNIENTLITEELLIAAAGPLSNIIIAGCLYIFYLYFSHSSWLYILLWMNFSIGLFNILPAIPMDGGRIVRTILLYYFGPSFANKIVMFSTYIIALIMVIIGSIRVWMFPIEITIILIGIFIWINAYREQRHLSFTLALQLKYKKNLLKRKGVMEVKNIIALQNTPVSCIIKLFLLHRYHFIYVVDEKMQLIGSIDERELYEKLPSKGYFTPIVDFLS